MNATEAYGELVSLGRPVVETREAATRLRVSSESATQLLRRAEQAGLVRRLRHGLWALEPKTDPVVIVPYLTAPYPAYVSLWSALAYHDMIEQIPAQVFVASLDRSRRIETSVGSFSIHHLTPELFDGYEGAPERGYMATAEKALFDTVYVRAPRGDRAYFPELELPKGFDRGKLDGWVERIARPRMRTIVRTGINLALDQAAADRDT